MAASRASVIARSVAVLFELRKASATSAITAWSNGGNASVKRVGQRLLARLLRQLRLTQPDQQLDQRAVPLLTEPEQTLVDRAAVVAGAVVHGAEVAECVDQAVSGQRRAGRVHQGEVHADPAGRDEEPVRCH